jgi:hypothetical protein
MNRILWGVVVACLLIGSGVKAEEPNTPVPLSEVPQRVITGVMEAPAKIAGWAQSEWQEIREFQAQGWADGKAQLNQDWQTIRGFFQTTESTN